MTNCTQNFQISSERSTSPYERREAEEKAQQLLRAGNVVGRIVYSTSGGPLRTIITGTKIRMSGIYQSVKSQQSQPYESPEERTFMKLCEADHSVRYWLSQPHRLEMFVKGRVVKYFPDLEILKVSGAREVVEIKRDKRREIRDELEVKLQLAEQLYKILGLQLRIVDREEIYREPRHLNAEEIQRHAHSSFTEAELFRVLEITSARKGRAIRYGELVERLGGGVAGKKKLCAMIVRRIFMVDLDFPINDETWVTQCPMDNEVHS